MDIVDSRSESDEDVRSASKISKRYADYIASLEEQDVMPHVYVNYMALLFGGQVIKNKIPGSGRFYDFENPQDHVSYIRSLQKDDWAEEANISFDHIISIYDELQEFFRRDSK
jgi:heme oxygenase